MIISWFSKYSPPWTAVVRLALDHRVSGKPLSIGSEGFWVWLVGNCQELVCDEADLFSRDSCWFSALPSLEKAGLLSLVCHWIWEAVYFYSKKTTKDPFVTFTFWSWALIGQPYISSYEYTLSAVVMNCAAILAPWAFFFLSAVFIIQKTCSKPRWDYFCWGVLWERDWLYTLNIYGQWL